MEFALALHELLLSSTSVDDATSLRIEEQLAQAGSMLLNDRNRERLNNMFNDWINRCHPDYRIISDLILYDVNHRLLATLTDSNHEAVLHMHNSFSEALTYIKRKQQLSTFVWTTFNPDEFDPFLCPPIVVNECPEIEKHIHAYISQQDVITPFIARDAVIGPYNIDPAYYELFPKGIYPHTFTADECRTILKEIGILSLLIQPNESDTYCFPCLDTILPSTCDLNNVDEVLMALTNIAFHRVVIPYWTRFIPSQDIINMLCDQIHIHLRFLSSQCCVAIDESNASTYQNERTISNTTTTISNIDRQSNVIPQESIQVPNTSVVPSNALRHTSICMLLQNAQFTPSFINHLLELLHGPRCMCEHEQLLHKSSMEYRIHLAEEHLALALENALLHHREP